MTPGLMSQGSQPSVGFWEGLNLESEVVTCALWPCGGLGQDLAATMLGAFLRNLR